ncbi:hypothetical protein C8F01DRAFT_466476 [Mycena amicta]|nr:hypothetical protein C8F01DRAFT_466476 [Mycena amicta]
MSLPVAATLVFSLFSVFFIRNRAPRARAALSFPLAQIIQPHSESIFPLGGSTDNDGRWRPHEFCRSGKRDSFFKPDLVVGAGTALPVSHQSRSRPSCRILREWQQHLPRTLHRRRHRPRPAVCLCHRVWHPEMPTTPKQPQFTKTARIGVAV